MISCKINIKLFNCNSPPFPCIPAEMTGIPAHRYRRTYRRPRQYKFLLPHGSHSDATDFAAWPTAKTDPPLAWANTSKWGLIVWEMMHCSPPTKKDVWYLLRMQPTPLTLCQEELFCHPLALLRFLHGSFLPFLNDTLNLLKVPMGLDELFQAFPLAVCICGKKHCCIKPNSIIYYICAT